jgi:hypothetical protein
MLHTLYVYEQNKILIFAFHFQAREITTEVLIQNTVFPDRKHFTIMKISYKLNLLYSSACVYQNSNVSLNN